MTFGLVINYSDIFSNFKIENNSGNNNINDNNDNISSENDDNDLPLLLVDETYRCLMPEESCDNNIEVNYKLETYYHFMVVNNQVQNGELEKKYIFNDKEAYDSFEYNPNSITIESHNYKFNINDLSKSYFYYLQFNGSTNNVSEYLKELEEKEYICEKI